MPNYTWEENQQGQSQGMGIQSGSGSGSGWGAVAGAVVSGIQNANQRSRQRDLRNEQEAMQNRLMQNQEAKEMRMWQNTNYSAQMKEMNKAGLNPAMMYGIGGGGGSTVGGGMPSASTPTPVSQTDLGGMGINGALAAAQIETMKSQANLNNVTAAKKAGIETTLDDQKQYSLGLDNALKEWMQTTDEKGNKVEFDYTIAGRQKKAELETAVHNALNTEIEGRLKEKSIKLEQSQIDKMSADIMQRAEEINQKNRGLDQSEQQLNVNKMVAEWDRKWENIIGKEAVNTIGGILKIIAFKK